MQITNPHWRIIGATFLQDSRSDDTSEGEVVGIPKLCWIGQQTRHDVTRHEEHHADDENRIDRRWCPERLERRRRHDWWVLHLIGHCTVSDLERNTNSGDALTKWIARRRDVPMQCQTGTHRKGSQRRGLDCFSTSGPCRGS